MMAGRIVEGSGERREGGDGLPRPFGPCNDGTETRRFWRDRTRSGKVGGTDCHGPLGLAMTGARSARFWMDDRVSPWGGNGRDGLTGIGLTWGEKKGEKMGKGWKKG